MTSKKTTSCWTRKADIDPHHFVGLEQSEYSIEPVIERFDSFDFDPTTSTLLLTFGPTVIRVKELEMPPAEARKLAAALAELADAAEAGR